MQYLGGKSKIRKEIAAFLESVRKPNQIYFEPFVGGGWVLQEMSGSRIASDGNRALIALYKALQDGWEPPEFVSEGEWRRYRIMTEVVDDPMQAFADLVAVSVETGTVDMPVQKVKNVTLPQANVV